MIAFKTNGECCREDKGSMAEEDGIQETALSPLRKGG